jgi:hypothetical protein
MAELDPDQEAALRRLRAAFGFVEVLRIIDHDLDQVTRTTTRWKEATGHPSRPVGQLTGSALRRYTTR